MLCRAVDASVDDKEPFSVAVISRAAFPVLVMTDVEHTPPSRRLPSEAGGYELVEQIGSSSGTSGVVYRAMCQEIDDEVAVRIIDLDQLQASLEDISNDIKVMSLSSHPNVLPFSTCFVAGNDLWVVMPLLTGGSVASLISCVYPDGLPPATAIYVLHSALKALDYFHSNGQIHRDVRAANILLDARGQVMLSDYGMMGWMVEGGWERKQRQTFVGTPCWMAPEVMEQTSGYDYKADIWSLGITAIELATGAAPYANYPAMKVLVMTLQNPPPRVSGRAADIVPEAFHDFVAACLEKDPDRRPTARQLLTHSLFESVDIPVDLPDVLARLPPVGSRAGAAQKMLYRQMQKAIAPSGSGIWNKPADRRGWDFGDESFTETVNDPSCDTLSGVASGDSPVGENDESSTAAVTSGTPASHVTTSAGNEQVSVVPSAPVRGSPPRGNVVAPSAGVSLKDAANPDTLLRQSEISVVTPGNTPFVTPANPPAVPAVSPDGDPRMSLPPSASGPETTNGILVGQSLGSASIPTQQPSGASLGVPGLPSKSGGLQKKGRFTVTDVNVSADKLNSKLNNFIDDDLDMSASGSAHASNGLGGAISNSSSFTSLPGGPSSENSPTSAVQSANPVVGRAVLPVGMEHSAAPTLAALTVSTPTVSSVPTPVHGHPAPAAPGKELRKGRFEVTPVEHGKGHGTVGTQLPKPRSRFETREQPESAQPPSASVPGDGAGFANFPRSPKLGQSSDPARLPSTKSRDALPTNRTRDSPLQSLPMGYQHLPPVPVSAVPPTTSASSTLVQNLTQCIAALGQEYETLRSENDTLRRDLERTKASVDPEVSILKQQFAQQQNILASQHSSHEKAIQQLQHRLQHLQRQHETLMSQLLGRQQDGTQQPQPQVVKLVQGQRSQGQPHQSVKAQIGTVSPSSHATSLHVPGSGGQALSVGTQSRNLPQPEHNIPGAYSHAVSGTQLPPSGQAVPSQSRPHHVRQTTQASGSTLSESRNTQTSQHASQPATSSIQRNIARPVLVEPKVPMAATGASPSYSEVSIPAGAGLASDATAEDASGPRGTSSDTLSQTQSQPPQIASSDSAGGNATNVVDRDPVSSFASGRGDV